jgi:hypothetical protein
LCTEHFVSKLIPLTFLYITTDHKEEEQLEDRGNVGEKSFNSGDGTDQRVQTLMFMMFMMMMMMILTTVTLATSNSALPDDGVTAPKHVGAVLI